MNSRVLPTPDKIYVHLPTLLQNGFEVHIIASLYRLFLGMFISFLIFIQVIPIQLSGFTPPLFITTSCTAAKGRSDPRVR